VPITQRKVLSFRASQMLKARINHEPLPRSGADE
jgi:nucleoid DNA-binding protein